jgi:hypothetical protein
MSNFVKSHFNPYLISCSCRKCVKGSRCKQMQSWIEEYELKQVLTKEDKEWLYSHGWTG